jgi:hypothetical protein
MGARRGRRTRRVSEQFVMLTIRMLASPAYQVLSLAARRVLDRLEIEHANQGGYENGKLTVTYDQFVEFGIHRTAVAPAIRELEMLGFIVVTQRGLAGIAEHRRPNKFMLTYLPADGMTLEHGKGDWRSVDTVQAAKDIKRRGRKSRPSRAYRPTKQRTKKQISVTENVLIPVTETVLKTPFS